MLGCVCHHHPARWMSGCSLCANKMASRCTSFGIRLFGVQWAKQMIADTMHEEMHRSVWILKVTLSYAVARFMSTERELHLCHKNPDQKKEKSAATHHPPPASVIHFSASMTRQDKSAVLRTYDKNSHAPCTWVNSGRQHRSALL